MGTLKFKFLTLLFLPGVAPVWQSFDFRNFAKKYLKVKFQNLLAI